MNLKKKSFVRDIDNKRGERVVKVQEVLVHCVENIYPYYLSGTTIA